MSVTICSEIVEIEALLPSAVDSECAARDLARLIPWVFKRTDVVSQNEDCTIAWPIEDRDFKSLFRKLSDYSLDLAGSETQISDAFEARESIKLLEKSWQQPEREPFSAFVRSQGSMLKTLMTAVYCNLEGIREHSPHIQFKSQLIERPGLLMAAVLAANITLQRRRHVTRDQEVFVLGFYESYLHIAYGVFPATTVTRVHKEGCAKGEEFTIKFTRGYNLNLKDDWLELVPALARLYRYLLSGNAKVEAAARLHSEGLTVGIGA
ncbi:uncharacterized protein BO80DRAFT_443967 [Aspergillus ibericus CBS 121593]|uniref:Uncharacterized protein n=1 Tax=Aspergillus ibericus CBS 121593 TaxID=1448316 RepID=A0A395H2R7_9EURO|nr:hypothetical protein BO80DRAFT_443967 [Aspergillus ibericus CBS 121593]RAL02171.1 hypothetical protein BO80DRAFT_443967 [Aspergillus ibericus CBS 121593]